MNNIASLTIGPEQQNIFTAFSGDCNPIHTDPMAARRTSAGRVVVHGVHALLRALDILAMDGYLSHTPAHIKAKFLKWMYPGDEGVLKASTGTASNLAIQVQVQNLPVLTAEIEFATGAPMNDCIGASSGVVLPKPRVLSILQMRGMEGEAYVASGSDAAVMFPHLAALLGARAVAELAATSYTVGMEVPGLHSTFALLDLALRPVSNNSDSGLRYQITNVDERFQKVGIKLTGMAIDGTIEAFVRAAPTVQPSPKQVASRVAAGEFSGMRALVIGGSRGLGEVTAKIVSAGGGEVVITYATGKTDADNVVCQIEEWGGTAAAIQYDVLQPPRSQLSCLPYLPTHIFFFATSAIFGPRYEVFAGSVFAEFVRFYVNGFYHLCEAMLSSVSKCGHKLCVYYPSSVAVETRPPGMTEYSMAKAAGEVLCHELNQRMSGIDVRYSRLPRLRTDQTRSVLPTRDLDPVEVLLPLVRERMRTWQSA